MLKVSFFHSLRVRITLALSLLVTSVMVMVILILWFVLSGQEGRANRSQLDDVIQARTDDVTALLDSISGQLTLYSSFQQTPPPKGTPLPKPEFSREITSGNPVGLDGVFYTPEGKAVNLSDRRYFKDVIAGADTAVSDAVLSKTDGKPSVLFAKARRNASGTLVGVDVVAVSLARLATKIAAVHYGNAGFVWIVDKAGTILAHPNPEYVMKNIKDVPGGADLEAAWKQGRFGEALGPVFGLAPHITHFNPSSHVAGWTVALSQPLAEFTATIDAVATLLLISLVVGLLLSLVLGSLVARPLIRPIVAAQRSFAALADGDADLTKTLAIKNRDELGVMVDHFNHFLATLRGMVVKIHEAQEAIRRALGELEAGAIANAATTQRIDSEVSEVHRQTEVQNRSVLQSSAAAEQIAANIESLDRIISDQAAAVTEASASVEQMARNIESVFNGMNQLTEEFQSLAQVAEGGRAARETTAQLILVMAEKSDSLHQANDVIAHIASQTNLLAMNAAIEAAHAGEAGRGFAVVADEIRKLAENASVQSKGIGKDIKAVEASIQDLVSSSDRLGQSLDAVEGRIQGTQAIVRHIHDAMAEQKQGSDQMLEALQSLNDLTAAVKTGSEEMRTGNATLVGESQNLKDATAQISVTVTGITRETGSLATAATQVTSLVRVSTKSLEDLERQVSRFKI